MIKITPIAQCQAISRIKLERKSNNKEEYEVHKTPKKTSNQKTLYKTQDQI